MNATTIVKDERQAQTLYYLTHPSHWVLWPFLPLIRRQRGTLPIEGVLFDARKARNQSDFDWTVFLVNVFALPTTLDKLLALPKEVHTSAEDIIAAGWLVD